MPQVAVETQVHEHEAKQAKLVTERKLVLFVFFAGESHGPKGGRDTRNDAKLKEVRKKVNYRKFLEKMQSVVRQNLHAECEGDINKLINLKINASYTYLTLGMYFDRDDVALNKFNSFFLELSRKEQQHAEKLLEYQNMRGGRILLQTIAKPTREDWRGGLDAMSFSLDYQKAVNTCILDAHRKADTHTDPHFCDFLEQNFLADSHDTIKKLGDYVGSLKRITASESHGSMGEYLFDKHTL